MPLQKGFMEGLTKRQREIVNYVSEFIETHRYSPSFREIMSHFGFSSLGTVHRHINILKRKGFFSLENKASRSLTVLVDSQKEIKSEMLLPFIGHLTANTFVELFSESRTMAVPTHLVQAKDKTYILRVIGDFLAEDLIGEGDLLLVEARQEVHNGETVVALINEQDTVVKRYFADGKYVRLMGQLPHPHPILIKNEDIQIQGILVGLLRVFS